MLGNALLTEFANALSTVNCSRLGHYMRPLLRFQAVNDDSCRPGPLGPSICCGHMCALFPRYSEPASYWLYVN
jgi:hypothetical protein